MAFQTRLQRFWRHNKVPRDNSMLLNDYRHIIQNARHHNDAIRNAGAYIDSSMIRWAPTLNAMCMQMREKSFLPSGCVRMLNKNIIANVRTVRQKFISHSFFSLHSQQHKNLNANAGNSHVKLTEDGTE